MYNYEEPSMFSGKKGAILIVVLLLHVLVGYGFYSGLARRIAQTIIPPVEIAQIDKPKADDKPPPPPPKLEEVKPFVPPPEFVDIQAPQETTNAITQTSQVATPAPVAAPVQQVQHTVVAAHPDAKHPFPNSEDYYPDASRRAGEEGVCRVKVAVGADGKIVGETIDQTSGFPRLDDACLKIVKAAGRMAPAMVDGKPTESSVVLPIRWKLHN